MTTAAPYVMKCLGSIMNCTVDEPALGAGYKNKTAGVILAFPDREPTLGAYANKTAGTILSFADAEPALGAGYQSKSAATILNCTDPEPPLEELGAWRKKKAA